MNPQITADDDLQDHDDYDDDFAELDRNRRPSLNLRTGDTDLFRGVLVALLALAVGALILTRGFDAPATDAGAEDEEATALSAEDPTATSVADGAMTGTETSMAATDATMTDPATPATNATSTSMTGDSTATATDGSTTTPTTAVTDSLAVRPPAEVEVLVLNATDRKGIAGQGTEQLAAVGYATVPAGNAFSSMGSVILYHEGYRAEALAVAAVFSDGLDGLVQPYDPADPPATAADMGDAKVIVVLGVDDAIPIG